MTTPTSPNIAMDITLDTTPDTAPVIPIADPFDHAMAVLRSAGIDFEVVHDVAALAA